MNGAGGRDTSPLLSWTTLAAIATLLVVTLGGEWTVFQNQINGVREQIRDHADAEERVHNSFQSQLDRRFGEQDRVLQDHMHNKVSTPEFSQFSTNIFGQAAAMREQLRVLEQTRPTTGELNEMMRSTRESISRMEAQIQAMQQYNLGQARPFQGSGK